MLFIAHTTPGDSTIHQSGCRHANRSRKDNRRWLGPYDSLWDAVIQVLERRPEKRIWLCHYEHWHTTKDLDERVTLRRSGHAHDQSGMSVYRNGYTEPAHIHALDGGKIMRCPKCRRFHPFHPANPQDYCPSPAVILPHDSPMRPEKCTSCAGDHNRCPLPGPGWLGCPYAF